MKKQKNILSSLNLILFVSSLVFSTLYGFSVEQQPSSLNHSEYHFITKHAIEDGTSCSQFAFEEKDNEKNENVLQAMALLAPFFVSFFQFELPSSKPSTYQLAVVNAANPIYLAVRNFRI